MIRRGITKISSTILQASQERDHLNFEHLEPSHDGDFSRKNTTTQEHENSLLIPVPRFLTNLLTWYPYNLAPPNPPRKLSKAYARQMEAARCSAKAVREQSKTPASSPISGAVLCSQEKRGANSELLDARRAVYGNTQVVFLCFFPFW